MGWDRTGQGETELELVSKLGSGYGLWGRERVREREREGL